MTSSKNPSTTAAASRPIELTAASRLLVIAPHPDDESLGCGGLILHARERGAAVRVLVVTDGDNNPWPQRLLERRLILRAEHRAAWGRRRRGEVLAAVTLLGLSESDVAFAGMPDQGLTTQLMSGEEGLRGTLRREIDAFAPTDIASPSLYDTHADHSAAALIVRLTLRGMTAAPAFYEYLVHGPATFEAAQQLAVRLNAAQVADKRAAILCHQTQTALSARRFTAYAAETETFVDPAVAAASHPVRHAAHEHGQWRIKLSPRRWFDRVAPAYLNVVACDGSQIVARRRVALSNPWRTIVDTASGAEVGRAKYSLSAGLLLPESAIPSATTLYLKRQGGVTFFDEAGWIEVAV